MNEIQSTISARENALERELEQLLELNRSVSRSIDALVTTKSNCDKLCSSSNISHGLLDRWCKILSQAEFTRDVLGNSLWTGNSDLPNSDIPLSEALDNEKQLLNELDKLETQKMQLRAEIEKKNAKRVSDLELPLLNKRKQGLSRFNGNSRVVPKKP